MGLAGDGDSGTQAHGDRRTRRLAHWDMGTAAPGNLGIQGQWDVGMKGDMGTQGRWEMGAVDLGGHSLNTYVHVLWVKMHYIYGINQNSC